MGSRRDSHVSMSERSQPPEKCLGGKSPNCVQRYRVVRWTPTTRTTCAVVMRWSRDEIRSRSRAVRALAGGPHGCWSASGRQSCCGGTFATFMPLRRYCVLDAVDTRESCEITHLRLLHAGAPRAGAEACECREGRAARRDVVVSSGVGARFGVGPTIAAVRGVRRLLRPHGFVAH